MKKTLLFAFTLILLVACNKNNDNQQPDQPTADTPDTEEPVGFTIALAYDSVANTVAAIPSDSSEYMLQIWMKEDYILDYGNDFSDAHILESLQSYVDMCIEWEMVLPTFVGPSSVYVYEFFDQPYPGEEFIAMAARFNVKTNKFEEPVFHLFFTTPK